MKRMTQIDRRRTLHPALPLVCLVSIQNTLITVGTFDGQQPDRKTDEAQESKRPGVEVFVLLKPEATSVGQVYQSNRCADYQQRYLLFGDERAIRCPLVFAR